MFSTGCPILKPADTAQPVPTELYSVENVPPERFQNYDITSGTQGGAVLFAPPSKSCRFSHPPSTCAQKHGHGEFRRLRTATQEAPRPLRESVLYLGACRLRRQIFREMKGKTEEILCGFPSIFLKYLGKDASKMRANRCKTDSKTSPTVLSWISLMRQRFQNLFAPAQWFLFRKSWLTESLSSVSRQPDPDR